MNSRGAGHIATLGERPARSTCDQAHDTTYCNEELAGKLKCEPTLRSVRRARTSAPTSRPW
jgi:hypothetical protein